MTVWGGQSNGVTLTLESAGPVPVGETVGLVARVVQAGPVGAVTEGSEMFAHVTSPGGTTLTYLLRDDGVAPDAVAGDRYFSASASASSVSTSASAPTSTPGGILHLLSALLQLPPSQIALRLPLEPLLLRSRLGGPSLPRHRLQRCRLPLLSASLPLQRLHPLGLPRHRLQQPRLLLVAPRPLPGELLISLRPLPGELLVALSHRPHVLLESGLRGGIRRGRRLVRIRRGWKWGRIRSGWRYLRVRRLRF